MEIYSGLLFSALEDCFPEKKALEQKTDHMSRGAFYNKILWKKVDNCKMVIANSLQKDHTLKNVSYPFAKAF